MKNIPSRLLLRCYQVLFLALPWSVEWSFGTWKLLFPAEPLIFLCGIGLVLEWRKQGFQSPKIGLAGVIVLAWALWLTAAAATATLPLVSWKYWLVECGQIWVFGFGILLFPSLWRRVFPLFTVSLAGVALYAIVHHGVCYHFRVDQAMLASMPFFADHTVFGVVLGMAGLGWMGARWIQIDVIQNTSPGVNPTPNPSPEREGSLPSTESTPLPFEGGVGGGVNTGGVWGKRLTLFSLALFALALLLTFSRAAWLSIAVAITVGRCLISSKKTRFGVLLVCIILLGMAFFLRENIAGQLASDVSSQERLNRWSCAVRMVADRPWTGFGPGTFQFQYLDYQRPEEMTRISVTAPIAERGPQNYGRGGGAHSEYLQALAELGWPGFLLWIALVLTVLTSALRVFFSAKTKAERWWALLLLLSLLSFFLHAVVNNFLHDARVAALVWGQVVLEGVRSSSSSSGCSSSLREP